MTLFEMRRAVEKLADITVGELLYTQLLVDYAIEQACVDVLTEELSQGNYVAGSQVYVQLILSDFSPLDSYDGGTVTGLPTWGQLYYAQRTLQPGQPDVYYPLFLESAAIIAPITRRCIYLPPEQFIAANTLPLRPGLKREYSFTIIGRQRYVSSVVGGNPVFTEVADVDADTIKDMLFVFTLDPAWEGDVQVKVNYWREPRLPAPSAQLELPDYLHHKVLHRAVQYVSMQMFYHPHPQAQMSGLSTLKQPKQEGNAAG